ncbi:MAG: hypothetical protein QNJ46_07065 [Leptolyngbyaceae cyanobacterium MO_188.B28]|nr:hypothetical protein [Leptolyngbyaceae cyanobacterium MO_188.B28]
MTSEKTLGKRRTLQGSAAYDAWRQLRYLNQQSEKRLICRCPECPSQGSTCQTASRTEAVH